MTIQPTEGGGALLSVTLEDLRAWGTTPEGLEPALALVLVRTLSARAGLALEGPLEIEAYPGQDGLLLFARPLAPRRVWFFFSDVEELLEAARNLGPLCPEVQLVWENGGWALAAPAGAGAVLDCLGERAAPLEEPPGISLRRDGALCMPGRVLALLLDHAGERRE